MKIEKRGNAYRIRKTYQGKTYSLTFDHKPNQKEITQALAEQYDNNTDTVSKQSFSSASEEYIKAKSNVLSPSSINGYRSILRNLSEEFCKKDIYKITTVDIQREINQYSNGRSAKTVRNAHGFISAILGFYRPQLNISTTLPQKERKIEYIPSDDDVRRIVEYSKGTEYEIPIMLAALGLRRSEICALTIDDLDGCLLTINKAKVLNDKNEFVIKPTKTTDSARQIIIPEELAELITEKGYIYNGFPGQILTHLNRSQDRLGIPRFRLHAMRHYYASTSHALGIPDAYIMQSGGWKSDGTLKRVYRHAMEDKTHEMQVKAFEHIFQKS